ncbi:MAG TPA: hypothetical protein VEH81_04640 [Ktedonobacteraceae bacterium]|nr:hypothetical protein [Ktedonobacteraceae bacterium]
MHTTLVDGVIHSIISLKARPSLETVIKASMLCLDKTGLVCQIHNRSLP